MYFRIIMRYKTLKSITQDMNEVHGIQFMTGLYIASLT